MDTKNKSIINEKLNENKNQVSKKKTEKKLSQKKDKAIITLGDRIILCAVLQVSNLGPLLFKIYINNSHKAFANLNITHFADDTNLCFHAKKLVQ